ncbi:MAG: preprotein translocase subunit SecG [Deltaproteobacteria bacterium]|nr:preprotein translocase subunit SecG [Deltaproteobacteria bacterium]
MTIVHILACFILVLVVLLQAGKGANMGAVFGGSSQTLFGSSGPGTFLGKMTTAVAIIFMLTSLGLSYSSSHRGSSIIDSTPMPAAQMPAVPTQEAPAMPAAPEKPAEAPAAPAAPAK